jgi:hypothetical protein
MYLILAENKTIKTCEIFWAYYKSQLIELDVTINKLYGCDVETSYIYW